MFDPWLDYPPTDSGTDGAKVLVEPVKGFPHSLRTTVERCPVAAVVEISFLVCVFGEPRSWNKGSCED